MSQPRTSMVDKTSFTEDASANMCTKATTGTLTSTSNSAGVVDVNSDASLVNKDAPGANANIPDSPPKAADVPTLNAQIELLWYLDEEDEMQVETWRKATVQATEIVADAESNSNGAAGNARVHILLLDAIDEYAEEVRRVRFLADNELEFVGCGSIGGSGAVDSPVTWRYLSDAADGTQDFTFSTDAFSDAIIRLGMEQLPKLPTHEAKHYFATHVRGFADSLKKSLDDMFEKRGPKYVMTEEDVRNVFDQIPKLGK